MPESRSAQDKNVKLGAVTYVWGKKTGTGRWKLLLRRIKGINEVEPALESERGGWRHTLSQGNELGGSLLNVSKSCIARAKKREGFKLPLK